MKWRQVLKPNITQHKYAIDSQLLGDDSVFAWSNLGYWTGEDCSYPQACQQLADRLAYTLNLNSTDRLLDLGCGKGASLKRWHESYQVRHIHAVELQKKCVDQIRHHFNFISQIHQASFLNLKQIPFQSQFDVILCIDAAYHSDLNSFISATTSVLNSKGRLGFHCLMLNRKFFALNSFQKLRYRALLQCADVRLSYLMTEDELTRTLSSYDLDQIKIEPISSAVLAGFAAFVQRLKQTKTLNEHLSNTATQTGLDWLKIEMTGKLCQKLAQDGVIEYVQITATKR